MLPNIPTLKRTFELEAARRIVGELADLIRQNCERLEVGGSIRRGQPTVKDAELIAIPRGDLWGWLETLVAQGVVEKAMYLDKNGKSTPRWGQKYRGILFQEIKVEIFTANEINWGFQKWLRTGPGDANQYIMGYLIHQHAPIRFIDGDAWFSPGNLWHKPKDKWLAEDKKQLHVPDEDTLFALLGMPKLSPNERTEQRYKALLGWNRAHQWPDFNHFVLKTPEAVRLVNVEPVATFGEKIKAGAAPVAISPFNVTDPEAWKLQVYRETVSQTESSLTYARIMAQTYPSWVRRVAVLEAELVTFKGLVSGLSESKSS